MEIVTDRESLFPQLQGMVILLSESQSPPLSLSLISVMQDYDADSSQLGKSKKKRRMFHLIDFVFRVFEVFAGH